MSAYEKFKNTLSELCERGKISKTAKKRFSRFDGESDSLAFDICIELVGFFEEAPRKSEEYRLAAENAIELISDIASEIGFSGDAAVVCAYIRLTVEANASDVPQEHFAKLKKHLGAYNESLQNIKHRLPLFKVDKDGRE